MRRGLVLERLVSAQRGGSAAPLILCYHAVSSTWRSDLAVSEAVLASHLERLRRRGFVGLTFAESERRRRAGTLPRRSVVVTFDDGYVSTARAVPLLESVGFPATVFVVTGLVEHGAGIGWLHRRLLPVSTPEDELRSLRWEELEELRARGWEVGSHTVTHPRLRTLDDDGVRREFEESRAAIAARLGSCETIAYPYGESHERLAHAAERAGYAAACILDRRHQVDEPYRRARVEMTNRDTGLRTRVRLSRGGLWLRRTPALDAALALERALARARSR